MSKILSRQHELHQQMLSKIGFSSVEELIEDVVPVDIRLRRALELGGKSLCERDVEARLRQLSQQNLPLRSFMGMGYYQNHGSKLISESLGASSAWATNLPCEQIKLCQGLLEGLHNFQSMVCSITGMDSACSALDQATATAQAMIMMYELRDDRARFGGKNVLFVDQNIFTHTLDLLLTYAEPLGIEIACDSFDEYEFCGKEFGAILQYPSDNGRICDYDDFCAIAHSNSMLVTAAVDLLSLSLLRSPRSWGADIVVGSAQRFGLDLNFGGPHANFIASRKEYKHALPGQRVSLDNQDQTLYIKEGAQDSCAEPLAAFAAGLYAMLKGPQQITEYALHAHSYAHTLGSYLEEIGYRLSAKQYFDTLEISDIDAQRINSYAAQEGINVFSAEADTIRISLDELTTLDEINTLGAIFAKAIGAKHKAIKHVEIKVSLLSDLQRTGPFLPEPLFNTYNNESDLKDYIKQLEIKDLATTSLRNISSKAGGASALAHITQLHGFRDMHPFAPADQCQGYMQIISAVEHLAATTTGLKASSLQAASTNSARYAALMVIRAYYQSRAQGYRNVALVPSSAKPQVLEAATMAGMKVVSIDCDQSGNIDLRDLKYKTEQNSGELCCLVLDYPSTLGDFDSNIHQIIELVHDHNGQVYMDSSELIPYIGLSSAGYLGADICQLNLHEIFELPFSHDQEGLCAVCAAGHLSDFLPTHPIVATGGSSGITAVSGSAFGRALVLPAAYASMLALGQEGIRANAQRCILNAAYIKACLSDEFKIIGTPKHKITLEIDNRNTIETLIKRGFYAKENKDSSTITIETSGSKLFVDRLIEALLSTKNEIENTK